MYTVYPFDNFWMWSSTFQITYTPVNIVMENGPFEKVFPTKTNGTYHCHQPLRDDICCLQFQLDGLGSPNMEPFAICPGGGNDPEASQILEMYHVVSGLSTDVFTVSVSHKGNHDVRKVIIIFISWESEWHSIWRLIPIYWHLERCDWDLAYAPWIFALDL